MRESSPGRDSAELSPPPWTKPCDTRLAGHRPASGCPRSALSTAGRGIASNGATGAGCRRGTIGLPAGSASTCCVFAFPWAGVLCCVRAKPPDLADLVGRFPADEIGHKAVHRTVAGRVHDHIGGQFLAVVEPDAVGRDFLDLARDQLDLAVNDELRRANVDVVARAAAQILHEQPGVVVAEVEPEARPR